MAPDLAEHVEDGFLRVFWRAEHAQGDAVDARGMALVKRRQRGRITGGNTSQQGGIV
jgi:hypothetical protein